MSCLLFLWCAFANFWVRLSAPVQHVKGGKWKLNVCKQLQMNKPVRVIGFTWFWLDWSMPVPHWLTLPMRNLSLCWARGQWGPGDFAQIEGKLMEISGYSALQGEKSHFVGCLNVDLRAQLWSFFISVSVHRVQYYVYWKKLFSSFHLPLLPQHVLS